MTLSRRTKVLTITRIQTDKPIAYIRVEDSLVDVAELSLTDLVQQCNVLRGEVSSQHRTVDISTMLNCSILVSICIYVLRV